MSSPPFLVDGSDISGKVVAGAKEAGKKQKDL